jgi:hypothetical protein
MDCTEVAPLAFESIEFSGITSIDPPFSPSVKEYLIHRTAGSEFMFKVKLNRLPRPRDPEEGTMYQKFPGYTLDMYISGEVYKSFWVVDSWIPVSCPPGESSFWIAASSKHGISTFCSIL